MAHWIDKKQKTRISDADYNILSKGMKKTIGAEGNTFGLSSKDYIEMNIFTSEGTFLDSIRLDEPKQYINVEGKFEINPGIILRRNGYFSGDYDIEFAFFREIAGSNQNVLVDSNKEIYTGEYDVTIDGRIVQQGTEKELEELEYKYFVHQISNDKKEIRLATLPINNEVYKREFEGLGEQESVIYPKTIGQDVLNFDNPSSKPPSNKFVLNNNSNIQLTKALVGGELVINDAFEIMDLSSLGVKNPDGTFDDGFGIDCYVVTEASNTKAFGGKWGFSNAYIKIGDKNNLSTEDEFQNFVFRGIASNTDSGDDRAMARLAAEIKGDSGIPFFGGAYTVGYRSIKRGGGFPIGISITNTDLNKIINLKPQVTATIKGRDLVDTSITFENTSNIKNFIGNGTKTIIPVPADHQRVGGLYDVELNLSFDINGTRRGIKIYRPNLFCVLPTWKKKDDIRPLETFVAQGINY